MTRFLLALLFLGLGLFHAALAAPEQYPEVIPGPGLPSLAELNLTSADLYTRPMPDVKGEVVNLAEPFAPLLPFCSLFSITEPKAFRLTWPLLTQHAALLARNPTLNRRYEPRCGPSEDAYANATEIIACFHLLLNLPRSTKCGASRVLDGNSYCKSGSSEIAVFSQSGNWTVSTWQVFSYLWLNIPRHGRGQMVADLIVDSATTWRMGRSG
ncbi:uncharacterized protein THITE_2110654 [Thermothielavioides terrestris NRRL 8126]|uniref:Uncharacterized protein n=1 Tax=Thermothielavioides terrestris (strain ATCC 38088 / NRRL 8126) TaxID=578455 RepID=G2QU20_THETT|nr:uncharacterized protein THITE_2110654 [Thermothielavioides terrestris NRRL 8126]AEO64481.1 hypothetical protein THITE_2110654 [Thermothielavioides terrestris NRRL 8126]